MYNIESFIVHCIASCINQQNVTFEDYEIIIVNDGSTDCSLQVAQESIKGISNARIVTRPNGGLSAARNTGIENAHGEFLWFVDGDDAIDANAVAILIDACATNYDIYMCNFSTFMDDSITTTSDFYYQYKNGISGKTVHENFSKLLPMMAWLSILRKDFVIHNEIKFLENIIHEDKEFSVRAHHLACTIGFIKNSLYQYRISRPDSIMGVARKDKNKSLLSEFMIIDSFKSFFIDQTDFTRRLFAQSAMSCLVKGHDSSIKNGSAAYNIYKKRRYELYRYLWDSKVLKYRLFIIGIICLPPCLARNIYIYIGNRQKLM